MPGLRLRCSPLTSMKLRLRGSLRGTAPSGWRGRKRWRCFKGRAGDCVLGADTIVVVDGAILGKPRDADDAVRMLRMLSGRTHAVITGVCVVGPAAGKVEAGLLPKPRW